MVLLVLLVVLVFFLSLYGLLYLNNELPLKEEEKRNQELLYQEILDKENAQKGYSFEQIISQLVNEKLKGAIVINNCILNKKGKGGKDIYFDGTVASKELDVIILSKKGLLVIEAKNYNQAFVSGNLSDKSWLASYSKNKCYYIYSPFKQVTEGVTTLKRYLPDYNFQRYVVFPDSTKVSKNLKTTGQVLSLTEFGWLLDSLNGYPDTIEKNSIKLIKELLIEENERARAMFNGNGEAAHLDYVKKCQEAASQTA